MTPRPDLEIIDGNLVDRIRSVKDKTEQAKMRQASLNNDKVMARVRQLIQVGKSENSWNRKSTRRFKNWLTAIRRLIRSSRLRKTARIRTPCHRIKILEEGMSVIVDMGCKFEGYCSDMTRTFFVGKIR